MNDRGAPVALISGAGTALGAAIARRLHLAGYAVLLHYEQAEESVLSLAMRLNTERKQSAHSLQASLLEREQAERLAREAAAHWGRLDLLINLATAFVPTSLKEASEQDWQALIGRNLKAPWLLAQNLAPALAARRGCIVNLADPGDREGAASPSLHALSLRALEALTALLTTDLGPEVRVVGLNSAAEQQAGALAPEALAERLWQLLQGDSGPGGSPALHGLPLVAAHSPPGGLPPEQPLQ